MRRGIGFRPLPAVFEFSSLIPVVIPMVSVISLSCFSIGAPVNAAALLTYFPSVELFTEGSARDSVDARERIHQALRGPIRGCWADGAR